MGPLSWPGRERLPKAVTTGYIHEDNAAEKVNRSKWTLRDWRLAGLLYGVQRNHIWYYDEHSLIAALETCERRYEGRRFVAGSGALTGRVRRYRCRPGVDEGLW